ncbi:MAG: hypothetical protein ACXACR_10005 [Candidatus Hodarchaeales archaeon]
MGGRSLLKLRKDKNQDISLIDCLQLCDKLELVLANKEIVDILNITDKEITRRILKDAETLRDSLAHSQNDLTIGFTWEHLANVIEYIENLLELSDQKVEIESQKSFTENSSLSGLI